MKRSDTRVSVVVVAYRSADVLTECIRSVPSDAEVIVVDQSSPDDTVAAVARSGRAVRLIAAGANRGFGAGCNIGAANATGDTLIFLNPDARLTGDAAAILAAAAQGFPGGVVGPRILDDAGHDVTHARRRSSCRTDVLDLLVPVGVQPVRWRREPQWDSEIYRRGGRVLYVHGACMAIDRELFWRCGGFDERLFIYGEEEYLAARVREAGREALIEPAAVVRHIGSTSIDRVRPYAIEQLYRSRVLTYRRSASAPGTVARTLALGTTVLALWLTTPARKAVGYRAVLDRTWGRAAMRGLWRGLRGRPAVAPDPGERR